MVEDERIPLWPAPFCVRLVVVTANALFTELLVCGFWRSRARGAH